MMAKIILFPNSHVDVRVLGQQEDHAKGLQVFIKHGCPTGLSVEYVVRQFQDYILYGKVPHYIEKAFGGER